MKVKLGSSRIYYVQKVNAPETLKQIIATQSEKFSRKYQPAAFFTINTKPLCTLDHGKRLVLYAFNELGQAHTEKYLHNSQLIINQSHININTVITIITETYPRAVSYRQSV